MRPRFETVLAATGYKSRPIDRSRHGFGVPAIDAAVGGGLLTGSNSMVLGASGAAKTTLGMHLLHAGIAANERGLMFTFYEHPEEIHERARRLGMTDWARGIEHGLIKIVWASSVESNLDHIGATLLDTFEEHAPKRVFIDGMHGFRATLDPPERIQDFFSALTDFFTAQHATFLYTAETHDIVGAPVEVPFANASRMCQNLFLIRFAELSGQLVRVWAVVKMRDSEYDPALRMLTVGARGIELGRRIDAGDMVLMGHPLRASREV